MPTIEEARKWYSRDTDRAGDAVHGFDHVLRVYRMAERLARLEGADMEIVRAAALLHDANHTNQVEDRTQEPKGDWVERRSSHQVDAAELARQVLAAEGWSDDRIVAVQHCIRSHRFRESSESPQTLEAQVLFDADKLDAIGAIGVARAIAYAACAGQPAYAEPSSLFLKSGNLEKNERHSAYHEYLFKLVRLKDRMYTSSGRSLANDRHRWLVDFFEQLAREAKEAQDS